MKDSGPLGTENVPQYGNLICIEELQYIFCQIKNCHNLLQWAGFVTPPSDIKYPITRPDFPDIDAGNDGYCHSAKSDNHGYCGK